jgi:thimet oligopeptidase
VRERCEALEREIAELRTEVSLDRGLFERLAALEERALDAPDARRLLRHALRDFRRSGVDRDEATRARLRALQEELVAIGQEFDRNIVRGGRELVIREGVAGLAGLPADFVAAHPPRADGAVVLSTDPHVRMAFLTYAERADLRREYYLAATNRAVPSNLEVLPRLLEKRHELATTLGYAHWADYATEDKMTRSAGAARDFLTRLCAKVAARARVERDELLAAKRAREPGAAAIHEWERAYWLERVKAGRFRCDSLALRAYFPFERVKQGVLDTAAALFGLEFRRDPLARAWHPSVECWELLEAGEVRARFCFDLHPREGKYKHAAMFPVQDGLAGETLPEAVLVCNFPEPGPGDPALLLHDQVTTFFHEFGHLLHHVLAGRGAWLSFAGSRPSATSSRCRASSSRSGPGIRRCWRASRGTSRRTSRSRRARAAPARSRGLRQGADDGDAGVLRVAGARVLRARSARPGPGGGDGGAEGAAVLLAAHAGDELPGVVRTPQRVFGAVLHVPVVAGDREGSAGALRGRDDGARDRGGAVSARGAGAGG